MALDLGFITRDELRQWAKNNPKIWGNDDGGDMFCCDSAFGFYEVTLKEICAHWLAVADRLEAAQ